MTRKDFLKIVTTAAAPTTLLGLAATGIHLLLGDRQTRYPVGKGSRDADPVRLIRPPGALAEKEFLAACIRCYRCQDACDVGAIHLYTEAHRTLFHTPCIKPSLKGCTLCMKCTEVCPTGALVLMGRKQKAAVRMGSVDLRKDMCLSHKAKAIRTEQALLMELGEEPTESQTIVERRGPCGECYMFCPLRNRAITLEPGSFLAPVIHAEHCVGCGMCEEICRVMVRGAPAITVVPTRGKI